MNRFSVGVVCFFICLFSFPFSGADDRREQHFANSSQENVKQITKRLQEIKQQFLEMVNIEVNSSKRKY